MAKKNLSPPSDNTTMVGLESNTMRSLIDRLKVFGVQKYIDLPQIAVMGDTSAGKSSVLSAISGIQFPSSHNLTTRCPTQLILSQASSFTGKVRIQRYEDDTKPTHESTIENIDQVPDTIERLTQVLVDEGQSISDDSIVIEVSGPGLPNLTLTDLPGLVRTVKDGEDRSIIDRIRGLVNRYLKESRTVILAVVPANVDIHNTEILQNASEVDPEGNRTVAIITKLDLVDKGAEEAVCSLLTNQVKYLKLGYHAVRCRGQQDLKDGLTIDQGMKKEEIFFKVTSPWNEVGAHLVGIPKLRSKLVSILDDRIRESLPDVMKEIAEQRKTTMKELRSIGEAMNDSLARRTFYTSKVDKIHKLVQDAELGSYRDSFFNDLSARLRAQIVQKSLNFKDLISIPSLKSWDMFQVDDEVSYKGQIYTITKIEDKHYIGTKMKNGALDSFRLEQHHCRPNLSGIKKKIAAARGKELPIFSSFSIFRILVQDHVQEWKEPMEKLLRECETMTRECCDKIIHDVFPQGQTPLCGFVSFKISAIIEEIMAETLKQLESVFLQELEPSTLNHYLYDNLTKLRMDPLKKALKSLPAFASQGSTTANLVSLDSVLSLLETFGIGSDSNEDREAFEMMTAVVAYLKVAQKRFIDVVPSTIDAFLFESLAQKVRNTLQYVSDKDLETRMHEDAGVTSRREALQRKLRALEQAIAEFC